MLDNVGTVLIGRKVVLVPYEREHVPKYHGWMEDPWLQEMTASEPLSLEEEYQMRDAWREEPDKCTFIYLAKDPKDDQEFLSFRDASAVDRMAGDVNLFFNDREDKTNCEILVMTAEAKYRRQGFGEEAIRLMMTFAITKLHVTRFFCKILETNEASIRLFKRLGYRQCNYVSAFKEYELELLVSDPACQSMLKTTTSSMQVLQLE